MNNLYLTGNSPLLFADMLVNFGDILPETSKSSACWDMGGNSHLTWLSNDNLYLPWWIKLELDSRANNAEGIGMSEGIIHGVPTLLYSGSHLSLKGKPGLWNGNCLKGLVMVI